MAFQSRNQSHASVSIRLCIPAITLLALPAPFQQAVPVRAHSNRQHSPRSISQVQRFSWRSKVLQQPVKSPAPINRVGDSPSWHQEPSLVQPDNPEPPAWMRLMQIDLASVAGIRRSRPDALKQDDLAQCAGSSRIEAVLRPARHWLMVPRELTAVDYRRQNCYQPVSSREYSRGDEHLSGRIYPLPFP